LAFANIKKAADYYDVDVGKSESESDWQDLGSRPRTGRTAEDRRESARAGVETKRERGELSEEARKGVDTKRESGVLTAEARKAVETKRDRGSFEPSSRPRRSMPWRENAPTADHRDTPAGGVTMSAIGSKQTYLVR
jgi:hypothetical protein